MSMYNKISDISNVADIINSISKFSELVNYFPQLSTEQRDSLNKCWSEDGKFSRYTDSNLYKNWDRINLHIVDQIWGSTACGYGGMGGAAMTSKYNIIFENTMLNILFVYWDGKLAYVLDNKDNSLIFNRLPSIKNVEKDKLIYRV